MASKKTEEDLLVHDQVEVEQTWPQVLSLPVEVRPMGDRPDGAVRLAGNLEELEHFVPPGTGVAIDVWAATVASDTAV